MIEAHENGLKIARTSSTRRDPQDVRPKGDPFWSHKIDIGIEVAGERCAKIAAEVGKDCNRGAKIENLAI